MDEITRYPNGDIDRAAREGSPVPVRRSPSASSLREGLIGAPIADVASGSPAWDAGFEPGCLLTSVDGRPLRDVIDWRWLSAGDEMELGYVDLDGEEGVVELWREPGQDWGFSFEGLVFDGIRQCCNACTFCFMHQLPRGMRPSLYLRDDDFRLSFLVGTFVTLTNLSPEDEARIIEQRISPLRVSLQASEAAVRLSLMGRQAQRGIDALERLLAGGIEFHAQIVLVPGGNDGAHLVQTLKWAYERPGILDVGIVPLGYTRHQERFDHSFNDESAARGLLADIEPFQKRALAERGSAWVFAADEFYRNAYREDLIAHLPAAAHYGGFELFEDGIGIIRSTIDDWKRAERDGLVASCGRAVREAGGHVRLIAGLAQREFLDALVKRSPARGWFRPLYVENRFFGGNVDVTGLLTGQDIVCAVKSDLDAARRASSGTQVGRLARPLFCLPDVLLNDDGVTLDDMTVRDMEKAAGAPLHVVSCSPLRYFAEIAELARSAR